MISILQMRKLGHGKSELTAWDSAQKSLGFNSPFILGDLPPSTSNCPAYFTVIMRRRPHKDPWEDSSRWKQCVYKPTNAGDGRQPPEAWREAWNRFSLGASRRNLHCQHLDFGLPAPRAIERINSCCFKPPSFV